MKWIFLLSLATSVAAAALNGLLVMLIWNAVVPDVFGLGSIDIVQAFLLTLGARLMFAPSRVELVTKGSKGR